MAEKSFIDIICANCRSKYSVPFGTSFNVQCASCGPMGQVFHREDGEEFVQLQCLTCESKTSMKVGVKVSYKCETRACATPFLAVVEPLEKFDLLIPKDSIERETVPISVIVVCHNGFALTKKCIKHIQRLSVPVEIVLVDNASTDDTRRWAEKQDGLVYVRNNANIGCGMGRNQGAAWARGKKLLFLDNDQFVPVELLDRMLEVKGDAIGIEHWKINSAGFPTPTKGNHPIIRDSYIGAGGLLISKKVFEAIKGFDERYAPAWYEDADFAFRLRTAGYDLGVLLNHNIVHERGSTTERIQQDYDALTAKENSRSLFSEVWGDYLAKYDPPLIQKPLQKAKRRPNVLFMVDVEGWAWWYKSIALKQCLEDQFNVDISLHGNGSPSTSPNRYDFYILYCPSYLKYLTLEQQSRSLVGVTCHPQYDQWFNVKPNDWCENVLGIHANSKMLYDLIKDKHERVYYLPNGVDDSKFKFSKRNIKKTFTAGYAGKPAPTKGFHKFIKAACELADVKLLASVCKYRDKNRIPHSSMPQFYADIDVVMIASTMDGTPNQLLEGASVGRTFIGNEIGNVPEFAVDGLNGYLVDRKVDSYVEKLLALKKDREKCREMGLAARMTIEREWTWEVQSRKFSKMFRGLL